MAFDIKTARPVQTKGKFDISTGRPVSDSVKKPSFSDKAKTFLNDATATRDSFINSATAGGLDAADWLAEKIVPAPKGLAILGRPKAKTLPGKFAEFTAAAGGGIYGLPGKASEAVAAKVLPGLAKESGAIAFGARRLRDLTSGATAGALYPGDIKTRAQSAMVGAVANPIVGGIQEGMKPMAGRLMNSILKPSKNLVSKGKNLGLDAAEAGYSGTKKGMLKKATQNIKKFEDELQGILKGSTKEADLSGVFQKLDNLKKDYFGNQAAINAIDDMKASIANEFKFGQQGKMALPRANEIKRSLYHQIKPSQYGTSEVPHLADIRKTAARGFKEGIELAEPGVGPINKRLATAGGVRDALEKQMANQQNRVILPKLAAGGAGLSMMMGNPSLAGKIILADATVEAARSAPVVSGLAKAFLNASKVKNAGRIITVGASQIRRKRKD